MCHTHFALFRASSISEASSLGNPLCSRMSRTRFLQGETLRHFLYQFHPSICVLFLCIPWPNDTTVTQHACIHTHTHISMCTRTHARTHTHTHTNMHASMHVHSYTRTHTHTYTCTHAHTHTHKHILMNSLQLASPI